MAPQLHPWSEVPAQEDDAYLAQMAGGKPPPTPQSDTDYLAAMSTPVPVATPPMQSGGDERDRMIRTVYSEAGGEPVQGQAAVAHVILNRTEGGKHSVDDVLRTGGFEGLTTDRANISPDSPEYQRTAQLVDGVLGGAIPDPTGGATQFLNPVLQAKLGRRQPAWATGAGLRIGNHVFYGPAGQGANDGGWQEVPGPATAAGGWQEVPAPASKRPKDVLGRLGQIFTDPAEALQENAFPAYDPSHPTIIDSGVDALQGLFGYRPGSVQNALTGAEAHATGQVLKGAPDFLTQQHAAEQRHYLDLIAKGKLPSTTAARVLGEEIAGWDKPKWGATTRAAAAKAVAPLLNSDAEQADQAGGQQGGLLDAARTVGGLVPYVLGGPAAPVAMATSAAADAQDLADKKGLGDTAQASDAVMGSALVSAGLGVLPIGEVLEKFIPAARPAIVGYLGRMAAHTVAGGVLGAGMNVGTNVAEANVDPTRPWNAGMGEQAKSFAGLGLLNTLIPGASLGEREHAKDQAFHAGQEQMNLQQAEEAANAGHLDEALAFAEKAGKAHQLARTPYFKPSPRPKRAAPFAIGADQLPATDALADFNPPTAPTAAPPGLDFGSGPVPLTPPRVPPVTPTEMFGPPEPFGPPRPPEAATAPPAAAGPLAPPTPPPTPVAPPAPAATHVDSSTPEDDAEYAALMGHLKGKYDVPTAHAEADKARAEGDTTAAVTAGAAATKARLDAAGPTPPATPPPTVFAPPKVAPKKSVMAKSPAVTRAPTPEETADAGRITAGLAPEDVTNAQNDVTAFHKKPEGMSLLSTIIQMGGVKLRNPDGSLVAGPDIAGALDSTKDRPGLVRNAGLTPEEVVERLRDTGWFGPNPEDDQVLGERLVDMIGRELGAKGAPSRKVYHPEATAKADFAQTSTVDRELTEAGASLADHPVVQAAKLAKHRQAVRDEDAQLQTMRQRADDLGVHYDASTPLDELAADVIEREAIQSEGSPADIHAHQQALDEHFLTDADHAKIQDDLDALHRSGSFAQQDEAHAHRETPAGYEPGEPLHAPAPDEAPGAAQRGESPGGGSQDGRAGSGPPEGPAPPSQLTPRAPFAPPTTEKVKLSDGEAEQAVMPGMEQSAVQAAKSREGRGKSSSKAQLPADQGLFAPPPEAPEPGMFDKAQPDITPTHPDTSTPDDDAEYAQLKAELSARHNPSGNFLSDESGAVHPEDMLRLMKMGAIIFKKGLRNLADWSHKLVTDLGEWVRPYLRGLYEQLRYSPDVADEHKIGMTEAGAITPDMIANAGKPRNVLDQRPNMEPSGGGTAAADANGQGAGAPGSGTAQPGAGGAGASPGAGGRRPSGGGRVPASRPPPVGEPGADGVRAGPPELPGQHPGPRDGAGGSDQGDSGVPPGTGPATSPGEAPQPPADVTPPPGEESVDAPEHIPEDIEKDLPFLRPGQKADVAFAEQRFAKPDGHGVLFTNGTGTGKTFVGLGIAKRFSLAGKNAILLVAPSDGILKAWQDTAASKFGLNVGRLEDTNDNGGGGRMVATTYANLGMNRTLADHPWDLVITDESHNLSQNQAGDVTLSLQALRAVTNHPDGLRNKARMRLRVLVDKVDALDAIKHPTALQRMQQKAAEGELAAKVADEVAKARAEPRSKVTFLSATPFSYDKSIEYAHGYLFDYGPEPKSTAYNTPSAKDAFFMQHFGYRMRYNRLTRPESAVDSEIMERAFHEHLRREKVLSGRQLNVPFDYDRKFALIDSAMGRQIDQAMAWLHGRDEKGFKRLGDAISSRFKYLQRQRLLEAIKAEAAVPVIRQHLELGRKAVVFHLFNEGGGFAPFEWSDDLEAAVAGAGLTEVEGRKVRDYYDAFVEANPYVEQIDAHSRHLPSPIATLTHAFPGAVVYNGTVSAKVRAAGLDAFNTDHSGKNLIIVQTDAGGAGISMHDTTGVHQRVIMQLGMPPKPVTSIQTEGRIMRDGQASNAIFRYFNTGTSWERRAFAQVMAERSGTTENLAMGDRARTLRASLAQAFMDSDHYPVHADEGVGGKEEDAALARNLSDFERAKTMYFGLQKKGRGQGGREGVDYYATPEPLGQKMVEWAGIKPGDHVLEPSAGHGAIARWVPPTAHRTFVEPSEELATRLSVNAPGANVKEHGFEDLHVNNKYDAIIMNPPFGHAGATAMAHIEKAAGHLRNGGRMVILMPRGAMDAKFDNWLYPEASKKSPPLYPVANIELPTSTFERAGTSARTRVVVLEKHTVREDVANLPQQRQLDFSNVGGIQHLFDAVEHVDLGARVEPRVKEDITPEQQQEALALSGNPEAQADAAKGAAEQPFETGEHKPATGDTTYTAQATRSAPRADWSERNDLAKKYGGQYVSKNRARNGEPVGWHFRTAEHRDAFVKHADTGEETKFEGDANPKNTRFQAITAQNARTGRVEPVAERIGPNTDRAEYDRVANIAARHGGKWAGRSHYKFGFAFPDEASRDKFIAEAHGEGSGNTIFTDEGAAAANARLDAKARGNQLNANLDPQDFADLAYIGAHHLERGARTFVRWAGKVVAQAGEKVRPHLAAVYEHLRASPTVSAKAKAQMTPASQVAALHRSMVKAPPTPDRGVFDPARITNPIQRGMVAADTAMHEAGAGTGRAIAKGLQPVSRLLGKDLGAVDAVKTAAARVINPDLADFGTNLRKAVSPMSVGSERAKAMAKTFANTVRAIVHQWAAVDDHLVKHFNADQRTRMWAAADEDGTLRRQGIVPGPDQGLNKLGAVERKVVDDLIARSQTVFKMAQELGMTNAVGLESYVPRMVIAMGQDNTARRIKGAAGRGGGGNDAPGLITTTPNLRERKHLETTATEAAAKQIDPDAIVVQDIRTLALATGNLERAIAGRRLIEGVRKAGADTGKPLVFEGALAGTFTLDHPAFRTSKMEFVKNSEGKMVPRKDQNGKIVFKSTTLHIDKSWEGPLKAVLDQRTGPTVNSIMKFKGHLMSIIMLSPLMHNAVEWGRAIPADPVGVLTGMTYFRGNAAKKDPALMRQAIEDGMDPISRNFSTNGDILGIAEQRKNPDSLLSKAGNLWHNTLLWDRVGDLQMGLYMHAKESAMRAGLDEANAGKVAAHLANRYAGAVPVEAMSKYARVIANLGLFSRSFTLGNLGIYKDTTMGLPSEVQAQIIQAGGGSPHARDQLALAQGFTRRKAAGTLAMDIALQHFGLWGAAHLAHFLAVSLLGSTAPYQDPKDNEPGKQDRALIGRQGDNTGVYVRLPTGKFAEDMVNWITHPASTIDSKLSPFAKLALSLMSNSTMPGSDFGKHIWQHDAAGIGGQASNLGHTMWAFLNELIPAWAIEGSANTFLPAGAKAALAPGASVLGYDMGEDKLLSTAQMVLPLAGITVSKGTPGGDVMAEYYQAKDQHEEAIQQALKGISGQVRNGDIAGARAALTKLGIRGGRANYFVKSALNPAARYTPARAREFQGYATPEQKAAMAKALAGARALTPTTPYTPPGQ